MREGRLSKQIAFLEGDTNIVPVMDEKTLYDGFIEVITNIYNPEKSYQRIINFFNTYQFPKTNVKISPKYGFKDIGMAFRILYVLGIKDMHHKIFWKLILWSILNSRKNLDKAIFYGVMIHQMHQTYLHIKQTVKNKNKNIYKYREEALLNIG